MKFFPSLPFLANPLSFSYKQTAGDILRLEKLLKQVKSKHLEHLSERERIDILTLACGRADETGTLADVFVGQHQEGQIIGSDIRDREIDEANERWTGRLGDNISTDFLVHDGTKLDELSSITPMDVAFLRHQNYWNGRETWEEIFNQAFAKLKEDGHLIITSYFDREHALAVEAIKRQGGVLIESIRNDHSRQVFDGPDKSVDRHIAVFKKS